jgi:hypothetical protein
MRANQRFRANITPIPVGGCTVKVIVEQVWLERAQHGMGFTAEVKKVSAHPASVTQVRAWRVKAKHGMESTAKVKMLAAYSA